MKPYHFAALAALMGISFVAAGLATMLARGTVENWYRTRSRPEKVPPPPAYGSAWMSVFVLMGAAAWLAWLTGPHWDVAWVRPAMILYFVMLGLQVAWSAAFFHRDRAGLGFAVMALTWLVTLATLAVFWQVVALSGILLIPVLLWTGYVGFRNLNWWRHGRHLGQVETQPQAPPTRLAA
jgi:tryptophan-rich sensory protein